MRYFIYRDSEIAGPFAPEELAQSGGLSEGALVCPESAAGRYDRDWLPASEVSELAVLRRSAGVSTAILDEPYAADSLGGLERLELDTFGVPGGEENGESWLADLMDDAAFRQRWGDLLPKQPQDSGEIAEARITELTGELDALRARLSQLESGAAPAPRPIKPPSFKAPPPAPIEPSLEIAPLEPELPGPEPEALLPAPELPSPPAAAPEAGPPIEPPKPAGPQTEFQQHGAKFSFKGQGKAAPGTGAKPIKFASSQSFRVVEPAPQAAVPPAPASAAPPPAAAAPAYEWGQQQAAPGIPGLPAAGAAPPVSPPPTLTPPTALPPAAAPAPLMAPEPAPSLGIPAAAPAPFGAPPTPVPTQAPFQAAPPAAAPFGAPPTPAPTQAPFQAAPPTPAPFGAPSTPAPTQTPFGAPPVPTPAPGAPPVTMMFGAPTPTPAAGAPPATGPVPFPSSMPSLDPPPIPQMPGFAGPATFAGPAPNPSAAPATDTGPSAKDVIARLAKPTAAPGTEPKPKPKKSPVMLIVGVGGLLALFVLIFFFLHDRRGLKSMVSMGGDQKPIGSAPVEEPKPVFTPKPQAGTPSPEAKPQSAQPATLTGGGTAAPSPAPVAGDKIPDAGETAIALVKNTPLMGDRGSVGQWLSYSYNADGGSKEDWTAGAVDATSYAVEYKVKPGPNSTHKEVISYLFEADTARKTVKGTNQAARSLLSGGTSAAPKKAAKPVYKRKARAKPSQAPAPKKVEQLPLPTDNELLPPAEDDANFKSDTVQPGL